MVSFGGSRKKWARRSPRPIGWNGFLFRNKFLFFAFSIVFLVGVSIFCRTPSKSMASLVSFFGVLSASGVPASVSDVSMVSVVSMVSKTGAPMFDFTVAFSLAKTRTSTVSTVLPTALPSIAAPAAPAATSTSTFLATVPEERLLLCLLLDRR